MANSMQPYERAMALAALSGLKIALGPAFHTTARGLPNRQNWVLGAVAEMVLDKVGVFPSRSRLPLLIPHTLAGAWVARESLKEDGVEDPRGALMGAAVAAGVATLAPMIRIATRKILGIPDPLLAVGEDYLALQLGCRAMDMPLDQVREAARESIQSAGDRIMPALETVGAQG